MYQILTDEIWFGTPQIASQRLQASAYRLFGIFNTFDFYYNYFVLKELCNIIEASDSHKSSFPYVFSWNV